MTKLIETFLNGNLTDAKEKAKHYGRAALRDAFICHVGFSFRKAQLAVDFLKGDGSFQSYCDAI